MSILKNLERQRASLQALRIPTGWSVEYNDFREIEPALGRELEFREDLLQLVHERSGHLLDLGWYPEGDVEHGEFMVCVIRGNFEGERVHESRSRDRKQIVAQIEDLLVKYGLEDGPNQAMEPTR